MSDVEVARTAKTFKPNEHQLKRHMLDGYAHMVGNFWKVPFRGGEPMTLCVDYDRPMKMVKILSDIEGKSELEMLATVLAQDPGPLSYHEFQMLQGILETA